MGHLTKSWIFIGVLVLLIAGIFAGVQSGYFGSNASTMATAMPNYTAQACANGQLSQTFCVNSGYTWNAPNPQPSLPTANQAYQNCLAGNPSHPELCDSLKPSPGTSPAASAAPSAAPSAVPSVAVVPSPKPSAAASTAPSAAPSTAPSVAAVPSPKPSTVVVLPSPKASGTYNQNTANACANGQLSQTFCTNNGYTWNAPNPQPSLPTANQAYQNCLSGNPSHPELCDSLKPSASTTVSTAWQNILTSIGNIFSSIGGFFR